MGIKTKSHAITLIFWRQNNCNNIENIIPINNLDRASLYFSWTVSVMTCANTRIMDNKAGEHKFTNSIV